MILEIIGISFLIFIVFGLLFFYLFQEKFIFLNGKKLERNDPFNFSNTFEEIFLKTKDNQEINAIHLKANNPKGVVLFFHGNKGNLSKWGERTAYFLNYNYDVFVIDYRNYGKSSGGFNEVAMYKDAGLAYSYIQKKFKEEHIVVYGYSLGCTFATRVASENHPKELILEAPFFNLKRATQNFVPFAPTFLLKYQFQSNKYFPKVKVPITIFHGQEDATTSFDQSKELFGLHTSEKNEFVAIKNGTHHNIRTFEVYKQKLKAILER